MTLPLQFADASDYNQLASALADIAAEFWWVPVLIGLFWYLRWYGKANRAEGVDNPTGKALGLWLKDMGRVGSLLVAAMLGIGAVLLGWAAFTFNILPTVFQGLAGGEPIVYAIVGAAGTTAGAAFDLNWATPANVVLVFFATLAIVMGLDKLGTMSAAAADDAEDAIDGDDD